MTRDELKEYLKLKLFYPQDVNDVMEAVDAYSSASNGAKPIGSGSLPLSEAQITELAHIGSNYVYAGVMEDGRIGELGILEVIKKYEEFKRQ